MFTKDPREPCFVMSAHIQSLQNSLADLKIILGFISTFHQYIFFRVSELKNRLSPGVT